MTMDEREAAADKAASIGDFGAARTHLLAVVAARPDDFDPWLKLCAMNRALRDDAGALRALDRALAVRPLDFTALLMRATMLEQQGQADAAGLAFGRAIANAPASLPLHIRALVDAGQAKYTAWQHRQADAFRKAASAATPLTPRIERFITNAVRLTEADRDGPTHYCFPDLPDLDFYDDRSLFPWMDGLEAATDAIQAEFEQVVAAEAAELVPYVQYPDDVPLEQWRALNHNKDWTAIHLIARGAGTPANIKHCPQTMAVLATIPQPLVKGAGANAMFSLLSPQTGIPAHNGITNTRLLVHLPLIIPQGCWFRVGDDTRLWARGKAWVFDDTQEHQAMNPSDVLRVILIADHWHPGLSLAERAAVAAIIGAGGQVHGL